MIEVSLKLPIMAVEKHEASTCQFGSHRSGRL